MTSKRLHLVFTAVIILLFVGLAAGAYGANKLLSSEANSLTALKAKNQALTQEQQILIKSKSDIKKYAELEKITRSVVPEDKNQAEAVREVVNIASANNIKLASIAFPASSLGSGVKTVSSTGATAAAPSSPAAGAAGGSKSGALSQLLPVKNIPGVYLLVITVSGDPNQPVPYNKFVSFLSSLEHNRRTAQVSTITLQPNNENRSLLSFTLTLNEYIKP
jgi:hypothetical protein